jgi:hypothetical protein
MLAMDPVDRHLLDDLSRLCFRLGLARMPVMPDTQVGSCLS